MLYKILSQDEFNDGFLLDFDFLLGVDIEKFFELDGKCIIDFLVGRGLLFCIVSKELILLFILYVLLNILG